MTHTPVRNRKGWRRVDRMRRHLGRTLGTYPVDVAQLQAALDAITADPAWKHKIIVLPPSPRKPPRGRARRRHHR